MDRNFKIGNKNEEVFDLTEEQFIELQAATILLEESFSDFDGNPEQFIQKADMTVPTPTHFDRTVDSTMLGNAIFVGIGKYGLDFINKLLTTDTAKWEIHCLFDYTMQLIDVLNAAEKEKSEE